MPKKQSATGMLHFDSPVVRNVANKYYIPEKIYKKTNFNPFYAGAAYILTGDFTRQIVSRGKKVFKSKTKKIVSGPGVGAWLRNVGSRLRTVTQKHNQVRFPVTCGYVSWLHNPVPGYAWLHKLAKKMRNRVTG